MMKREERELFFSICGPHMIYHTWQKFNPRGHMSILTVNVIDGLLGVFFEHLGYFECKYELLLVQGV